MDPHGSEPAPEEFLEADDIPVDDPLWEEFYSRPFVLPPDPLKDCWNMMQSWP